MKHLIGEGYNSESVGSTTPPPRHPPRILPQSRRNRPPRPQTACPSPPKVPLAFRDNLAISRADPRLTKVDEDKGYHAEKGVHGVQSPADELLKDRSRHADPVVLRQLALMTLTKSQFVAVDKDTPRARKGKGMISGGYSQGTGPQLIPKAALYMTTQTTTALGVIA